MIALCIVMARVGILLSKYNIITGSHMSYHKKETFSNECLQTLTYILLLNIGVPECKYKATHNIADANAIVGSWLTKAGHYGQANYTA
jgi:hypothetical protein